MTRQCPGGLRPDGKDIRVTEAERRERVQALPGERRIEGCEVRAGSAAQHDLRDGAGVLRVDIDRPLYDFPSRQLGET